MNATSPKLRKVSLLHDLVGRGWLFPSSRSQRAGLKRATRRLERLMCSFLALVSFVTQGPSEESAKPPGMVWIPGGEFAMGTDEKEAYTRRSVPRIA